MIMTAMLSKAKESRETREKTSQTSPKKPVRSLGKKPNGQAGSEQVRNKIPDVDPDLGAEDIYVVNVEWPGCCYQIQNFQDLAGKLRAGARKALTASQSLRFVNIDQDLCRSDCVDIISGYL